MLLIVKQGLSNFFALNELCCTCMDTELNEFEHKVCIFANKKNAAKLKCECDECISRCF